MCCWKGIGSKSDLIEFKISQISELKKGENCEINSIKFSNKLQKIGFGMKKKTVEPSILRQLKHVELDENFLDEDFFKVLKCLGNFWGMSNDRLV